MMRRLSVFCAFATVILAACATAGAGGGSGGSYDVITSEEIARVSGRASTAYAVVRQLEPQWLRGRGAFSMQNPSPEPVIYVDNTRFGGVRSLQNIAVTNVEQIRYLDPSEATMRFGTGHAGGVIMVSTKG